MGALDGVKHAVDVMVPAALFVFGNGRPGSGMPLTHVELREPLIADFFGEQRQGFLRLATNYTADLTESWSDRLQLSIATAKEKLNAPGA